MDYELKKELPVFSGEVTQIESILPDDEGNFFLSSEYAHLVAKFDNNGRMLFVAGEWIFPGQPEQIIFYSLQNGEKEEYIMVLNEMIGAIDIFSSGDGAFVNELVIGVGKGFGKVLNPDGLVIYNEKGRWKLFISDQVNRRMVKLDLVKLEEGSLMAPELDLELRALLVRFCEWVTGIYFNTPGYDAGDETPIISGKKRSSRLLCFTGMTSRMSTCLPWGSIL